MAASSFDGTIIIGAGQSGLAVARQLREHGAGCQVLEAAGRPGDAWRHRWDSLRLFTPAQYCALPGLPFPAPRGSFPARDEVAAYLAQYAEELPVEYGVEVTAVRAADGGFDVETTQGTRTARSVVVATGANAVPHVPELAGRLSPRILQLHSSTYRNPGSVPDGGVLVVGAGTSGVEIAVELAATHAVWLSGRAPVHIPAPLLKYAGGLYWQFIHRVLTLRTPIGRKVAPKVTAHGAPLISVSIQDAQRAGATILPRLLDVADDGEPAFPEIPAPGVRTVIWATGYRPYFSWIEGLPVDGRGWPVSLRGAVAALPGLYFVGMPFQYGLTSALLGGVGRDADHVARSIVGAAMETPASPLPAADG
ncbi:potassium transporter Trk [Arthrobacter livingstonensis]|uniref:Potassium transporter Trk n=1 Tax=Arthrobacter livingstonensis TaxID=670078 RepID=A0A2V5L5I6_9MICC|nr:NAD(P)-binding domain-containing protein [Arthrobacter livingstonensis]PYI66448.1 potassium transporter Trk [Arthrobacter livingstonensis]